MKRYMCLGCGRFWSVGETMVPTQHRCPHCGDMYFSDNIDPDVPPPLFMYEPILMPCGHVVHSDVPGDVTVCCVCGREAEVEGETLQGWQESRLREMGI